MKGLENKYKLANKLLELSDLEEFREGGLISEVTIRNCRIIKCYCELRKEHDHIDSLEILAEKFFLSEERILGVLYK